MMARLNGGGETNIDPGFKVVENDIAANVLAFEPSPGKMTELFQSGQGVIAVWGSGRVASFAETGFPAYFIRLDPETKMSEVMILPRGDRGIVAANSN